MIAASTPTRIALPLLVVVALAGCAPHPVASPPGLAPPSASEARVAAPKSAPLPVTSSAAGKGLVAVRKAAKSGKLLRPARSEGVDGLLARQTWLRLTPDQIARLMAARTTESWTTVPHFFLTRDVDCTELVTAQKKLSPSVEKSDGTRLTITDLLIALVARVLAKHPVMNASTSSDIQAGLPHSSNLACNIRISLSM